MPATFPVRTNYVNGDIYAAVDVNDYGLATNALYDASAVKLVTTKGDLLAGSASATVVRVAVGTNNTVLCADSSQSGGLTWRAVTASDSKGDGAATSIVSIGTALPSATSSKIHFGTSTPASGLGAIGDIFIQY